MRISFWNLKEFKQELKERGITQIRRDFIGTSEVRESTSPDIGKIGVDRIKLVLTASDGKDVLRYEEVIFSCFSIMAEEYKDKVKELIEKIKGWVKKEFKGFEVKGGIIEA